LPFANCEKKPLYTGLNIAGLAIGVAACLLIVLYVAYELSYDRWNPQSDRIVRPVAEIQFGGSHYKLAVTGPILAPEAAAALPEIQTWWGMNQWLADFAYHIEIQWWMIALASVWAILIAFLTVSFQSIKAALANPVKSLRSEQGRPLRSPCPANAPRAH